MSIETKESPMLGSITDLLALFVSTFGESLDIVTSGSAELSDGVLQ